MRNERMYHSRRPHFQNLTRLAVRLTWSRSIAKTPIWQVTLDNTSTVVLIDARVRSRCAIGHGSDWPLSTERIVKYIANRAAKNISSLDNQMMVPTLARFGLLAGLRGTAVGVSVADAVATLAIITTPRRGS